MVTEIELKYSLLESNDLTTPRQIQTNISQLLSEHELVFVHQEKQLSNHYFDTVNLTLRKNKIALRTRGTQCLGEAERFEQTIKTSGTIIAGLHQRPEYNVDITDDKPTIALFPDTIWPSNTDLNQLQLKIIELFSTNFTRHTWLVSLADAQIEIAFDCGEVACQGYTHKPRIYEIELELVNGDAQALFLLTKLLFSQLALRPGQLTKAARGYALYHESLALSSDIDNKQTNSCVVVEPIALSMIDLPKKIQLNEAFSQGIEFSLTQLQHSVDGYVETPSLTKLNKISELLVLLRQGFWLFSELLMDDDIMLRNELSYFIRTIHWVDNALYIQSLTSKQSSYQKEMLVNQELITKLQLGKNRYPNESQVLALLHSERFNNLQLDLLSLLLKRNNANTPVNKNSSLLIEFAAKQLTNSTKALNIELAKLQKPQDSSSIELYLTAHSLLIRALLTTSWFSGLFAESGSEIVKRFNMPWLDIKQGISELQSLSLLQQQLVHLPKPEKKLALWLANKSENLITALDQSRAKALTMKPYWP
ncbi:CYTH domain-containing protein [Colwellia sp. 12G3]|uniref:CYTH domain-containing protein n=1 Tax=Colwellia sp. 12G3 TaxID=2058299 RepID=UPI000C330E82|nr:CYTH domain-containing protein [Colwellia sp. 12G3]PKI12851.1 CYTH domain-containing protein [Colwellia sp. 12G3]